MMQIEAKGVRFVVENSFPLDAKQLLAWLRDKNAFWAEYWNATLEEMEALNTAEYSQGRYSVQCCAKTRAHRQCRFRVGQFDSVEGFLEKYRAGVNCHVHGGT